MSKGFTLLEMIGVILIICILLVMTIPAINTIIDNYQENAYQKQVTLLEKEASKWAIANTDYLPENSDDIIFVNLDMLIDGGYLSNSQIIDPRNNKELKGCITIKKDDSTNQYLYTYVDQECDQVVEKYSPTFIVEGIYEEEIEVNSSFSMFNVSATSHAGSKLKVEGPKISKNGNLVAQVNTSKVNDKFILVYKAYDVHYAHEYEKEYSITIVDTQKPVLAFESDSGVVYSEGTYTINVNKGDSTFKAPIPQVIDNSCGLSKTDTSVNDCSDTLKVSTRGLYNVNIADNYEYTYYATDSSGNEGAILLHIIVQ